MKMKGAIAISVTATPQRVAVPSPDMPNTLRNDGTGLVYYRYDESQTTALFIGASAAVLRALGASELKAGVAVVLPEGVAFLDLVCITGATATAYLDAGEQFQLAPV